MVSDARSTSPTRQCVVWTFGCSTNQLAASSMPQEVQPNDNDPQAQEQHMHQWFRAPGVGMARRRTRLGLFRTWGKTREAGDPLGESHISFTTLSLLTIHAITIYRPGTLFPPVTASPPIIFALTNVHRTSPAMPFHQTKHSPSHIGVVRQAAQNKRRSTVSRLLWMPSTSPVEKGFHVGILRPVGCSRVQGDFILFCVSLLCPTYANNKRKWEESKELGSWIDVMSERVPWAWQTL